jgi:hypothetical protein
MEWGEIFMTIKRGMTKQEIFLNEFRANVSTIIKTKKSLIDKLYEKGAIDIGNITEEDLEGDLSWLLDKSVKFSNAKLSINRIIKKLVWEKGTWEKGTWKDGEWKRGTWLEGTWEKGTWLNGTWESGTWEKGTWENGIWEDGVWYNGTWVNGTWKEGYDKNNRYHGKGDSPYGW